MIEFYLFKHSNQLWMHYPHFCVYQVNQNRF